MRADAPSCGAAVAGISKESGEASPASGLKFEQAGSSPQIFVTALLVRASEVHSARELAVLQMSFMGPRTLANSLIHDVQPISPK